MSELTEQMRRASDQSADYWADLIGSIVAGSTAPGGSTLAARLEDQLREAADRIEQLEAEVERLSRLVDVYDHASDSLAFNNPYAYGAFTASFGEAEKALGQP